MSPFPMISLIFSFCIRFCTEFLFPAPVVSAQSNFDWSTVCLASPQRGAFAHDPIVPIDYSNENGDKAALAVIKLSVQSKTEYKGAVLMNPGGPGASGVAILASIGSLLASVVGNQYDIISFDPRGVGNSTPRAEFFPSKEEHYQWIAIANHWNTVFNTTSDEIPYLWASAQVIAELAKERNNGTMNYISMDNIARDMLRINEAAGQAKLQYWGFSYGTVLGSTFATMFPVFNYSSDFQDKVERVLDMDRYYHNDWRDNSVDADKDMQSFFDGCVAAGPDRCAFYAPTATEISNKLDSLYESILAQPVPFVTPSFYGVVDYTVLRTAVKNALYQPYQCFSVLAEGIAGLAAGNGSILYGLQGTAYDPSSVYDNSWEAQIAISCGDAPNNTESVADLFAYWDIVKADGSSTGKADLQETRLIPLLLSLPTKTSRAFPGSVVLTQNSSGHTSLAVSSTSTHAYVRSYFQNGILPGNGSVCEVESEMFPASSNGTGAP
ncbi:hypothetical protein EV421DRAFT_1739735 [Armillaria borealis]|uniref:AB hydrolase-1 domain-containing protein n=1 Tax=Armillaria borealis TaxID=47425 RepID=A0AA39MK09_9AGAR|nr:hypothetical protein EV421DRAFT_1739735 [Armillaria borealis]